MGPGQVVLLDNLDSSFVRIECNEGNIKKKVPVKSIQGFRDVIVATDQATGVIQLFGRARNFYIHSLCI